MPKECRPFVLKLAHDVPVAGHFSYKKTFAKCIEDFWWPGIFKDVYNYCRSCDVCQRTSSKGLVKRVPMERMPIKNVPFQRVAIDLIGPFIPASSEGRQCVNTS